MNLTEPRAYLWHAPVDLLEDFDECAEELEEAGIICPYCQELDGSGVHFLESLDNIFKNHDRTEILHLWRPKPPALRIRHKSGVFACAFFVDFPHTAIPDIDQNQSPWSMNAILGAGGKLTQFLDFEASCHFLKLDSITFIS
jgi:hypothetical protein